MTDTARKPQTIEDLQQQTRVFSDWASPKGMNHDILPWRLWDKGKKLHWDPADLDFTQDAKDWANIPMEQRLMLAGLANGFMVGEEGVTLDIMPLVFAIADEGRAEETLFLTQFAYEEAKHVDFFSRWFKAIGADPLEMRALARSNQEARGVRLPDPEQPDGLFESILPRTMRRVLTDRSPEAFLDCSVTYNQFIEGCLAIAGYKMWKQMFDTFGVMPGLRKGLGHIQDDERRHIAYGTFLCRRIISENNELAEFAAERMYDLRDHYLEVSPVARAAGGIPSNGDGPKKRLSADQIIAEARKRAEEFAASAGGNGDGAGGGGYGGDGDGDFMLFGQVMLKQVDRRIELLRNAAKIDSATAKSGAGAEEIELELENVS
ncbi:MAG: R2-like ligand-binding oxidase [Actinomycetota bacterium]